MSRLLAVRGTTATRVDKADRGRSGSSTSRSVSRERLTYLPSSCNNPLIQTIIRPEGQSEPNTNHWGADFMKSLWNLRSLSVASGALVFFAAWINAKTEPSGEWPQWRGPNRDGISTETGLLKQWPADGPARVWKTNGLGNGYSTVSISKGRIFTMGLKGNREFVLALDASDGKPLWIQAHGGRFSNDRGDGPRGTPTIDGDRVYALGGNGDLSCLEAANGKIVWSLNLVEKFGASNPHWGTSESPLILGDRLLVNAGGPNASIV